VTEKPGGKTCDRIYLGDYELYRERNAAGVLELERETLHVQDNKGRIALIETLTAGTSPDGELLNAPLTRFQLSNHLGSAALELNADALLISYEEYYAFGASSYQAVDAGMKAAKKRYRYVGKERDEGTGLDYYGARYYMGWLGRWGSCDPAGFVDGLNLFQFCRSNALNNIDQFGLDSDDKTAHELINTIQKEYDDYLNSKNTDNLDTKFAGSLDKLIDYIDSVKDRPLQATIENKEIFFEYLKIKGYAQDKERTWFEEGCIGITKTYSNVTNTNKLKELAIYKTFEDAKANYQEGDILYSIHFQDSRLWLESIETTDNVLLRLASVGAANITNQQNYLNLTPVKKLSKGDKTPDYLEKDNNKISIKGWEHESAYTLGTNFDFGTFLKDNAIVHANNAEDPERGMKMQIKISNRIEWERVITDDGSPMFILFGCENTDCYEYHEFNRQVYGIVKMKK